MCGFIPIGGRFTYWINEFAAVDKCCGEILYYANTDVITWALLDPAGATIASGTFEYLSGTNGDYRMRIPDEVTNTLIAGKKYALDMIARDQGVIVWRDRCELVAFKDVQTGWRS